MRKNAWDINDIPKNLDPLGGLGISIYFMKKYNDILSKFC